MQACGTLFLFRPAMHPYLHRVFGNSLCNLSGKCSIRNKNLKKLLKINRLIIDA
jgi:hypothetical protein